MIQKKDSVALDTYLKSMSEEFGQFKYEVVHDGDSLCVVLGEFASGIENFGTFYATSDTDSDTKIYYALSNMRDRIRKMKSFGNVLEHLRRGYRVRRDKWSHNIETIIAADGSESIVKSGSREPFAIASADILAKDWIIV